MFNPEAFVGESSIEEPGGEDCACGCGCGGGAGGGGGSGAAQN